jgi:hypothetical protein
MVIIALIIMGSSTSTSFISDIISKITANVISKDITSVCSSTVASQSVNIKGDTVIVGSISEDRKAVVSVKLLQTYIMSQSAFGDIATKIAAFLKSSTDGTGLPATKDRNSFVSHIENIITTNIDMTKITETISDTLTSQSVNIEGKGKVVVGHISLTESSKVVLDVVTKNIESSKISAEILGVLGVKQDAKTTGFMTGFNNLLTSAGLSMQTFAIILPIILVTSLVIGLIFLRWLFKSDPVQIRAVASGPNSRVSGGNAPLLVPSMAVF